MMILFQCPLIIKLTCSFQLMHHNYTTYPVIRASDSLSDLSPVNKMSYLHIRDPLQSSEDRELRQEDRDHIGSAAGKQQQHEEPKRALQPIP